MPALWYLKTFRVTGVVIDGEPVSVLDWTPITTKRANDLTLAGLGDMVRLGRPACSDAQAQAIEKAGAR